MTASLFTVASLGKVADDRVLLLRLLHPGDRVHLDQVAQDLRSARRVLGMPVPRPDDPATAEQLSAVDDALTRARAITDELGRTLERVRGRVGELRAKAEVWAWRGAVAVTALCALAVAAFCLMALVATMASPIAWEHHYGIALPIFVVAWSSCSGATSGSRPGWIPTPPR